MNEPQMIRVVRPTDAELYRERQAIDLLREAGFVPLATGEWVPSSIKEPAEGERG
jgi:hypothetical protein